jgi:drug/metabolite transporter (DMT)-like permease
MNSMSFLLVVASVSLNAFAQVLLRSAAIRVGPLPAAWPEAPAFILTVVCSPYLIMGMACYAISIGIWFTVLARVQVSAAYPFLSIGYVITAFIGYFLLQEQVTLARWFGIAMICAGLFFVAEST